MVPICLLAHSAPPFIDFPRLVSIPNGPLAVCHVKLLLETLSKSPLDGFIENSEHGVSGLEGKISECKNSLAFSRSLDLKEIGSIDLDMRMAFLEEGVTASSHFGFGGVAIDVEGR